MVRVCTPILNLLILVVRVCYAYIMFRVVQLVPVTMYHIFITHFWNKIIFYVGWLHSEKGGCCTEKGAESQWQWTVMGCLHYCSFSDIHNYTLSVLHPNLVSSPIKGILEILNLTTRCIPMDIFAWTDWVRSNAGKIS
jgi:hypothetical protein